MAPFGENNVRNPVQQANVIVVQLVTFLVAAYLRENAMSMADLPRVIADILSEFVIAQQSASVPTSS